MAMIKRLIVIVICTLVFVSSQPEITIAAQTSTTTTENDVNSQNQETIVQDVDTSDTELTEAYEDTVDDSTVSDNEKNIRESTDEFGLLSEPIQEESDIDEEAVPKTEDVPVEGNTNDTEHSKKSSPVKNSGKHFQDEKGHETQGENIVENESTEKKKDKHADIGTEFVTDTASEEEVTSPLLNSEEGYIRVTLDANGGYFDIIDDQGDYVEESETMSYLIKEGECLQYQSIHHNNADYYLASWSLERNGEPIEDIEYYVPEEDITLYAVWGIYNVVYFDANGGVFPEDYAYETNDERTVAALKTVPGNIRLPDRIPYYEDGTKRISGWSEQRGGAPVIKQSKERQYKRIGDLEFIDGLVLYAVWENPIKVTLDANGGFFEGEYDYETNQFAHKITIEEYGVPGEEYPLPTPFNDDKNLIFARWNDDRDGNGKTTISSDIESFNVSESCTLYAIWEEPVVVTFDLNGGHCSEEVYDEVLEEWVEDATVFQKRVSPGDDVDISVDETKPVYKDKTNIFAGWSMTKGGYPINSDWFYPEESCTLYAIWKTPCDVTFDLNGGHCTEDVYDDSLDEWIEDAEIFHKIIPLGGCVAVGTSGYGPEYNDSSLAFAGWSLTKGGDLLEELFYYYPDSSCTLYAVWKEPFEVTFDANGGVFDGELYDDVLQQYVRNVSSVIKRIDPTDSLWLGTYKDGAKIGDEKTTLSCSEEELIFAGWSQSKGGEPIKKVGYFKPEQSCTLYAVWKYPCTILLNAQGGYIPETGWDYDSSDDSAIYVDYKKNGTGLKVNAVTGDYVYLPDAEYNSEEKIFDGWSLEEDGPPVILGQVNRYLVESDCTLFARWVTPYTVTWDANGGYFEDDETEEEISVEKLVPGSKVGAVYPKSKDNDQELIGWSLSQNGSAVIYVDSYGRHESFIPDGDVTLYAVWGEICTITYDANGGYFDGYYGRDGRDVLLDHETILKVSFAAGSKVVYQPREILHNDSASLEFAGWGLTRNDEYVFQDDLYRWDTATFSGNPLTADCTLYAIWKEPDCTITIDSNGGSFYEYHGAWQYFNTKTISTVKGKELSFDSVGLNHPDGKVLAGFSLQKSNGSVVSRHENDGPDYLSNTYFYTPEENCTLYALWTDVCTVTLDAGEGHFSGYIYDDTENTNKYSAYRRLLHRVAAKGRTFDVSGFVLSSFDSKKQFVGWSMSKNGGVDILDGTFIPAGDCTLYAVWKGDDTVSVSTINIDQTDFYINNGFSVILKVSVYPEDASNKSIVWNSNDETIAKVDQNGKVTGIGAGTATIIAAAADGSGVTAECRVTVIEEAIAITDVSAASYNKLNVSWEKCEGADGYMVYRKGNGEAYALIKSLSGEDSTSFINSVVSGAKYTYKVSAYKMDGKKKVILAQTGEMSGTALPEAPVMKSTGMAAFNKIKVIWTKVSGCAGYVIYRSTEEDGQYTVLKTVTMATATEYSNIVQDGQTYYYKICAFVEVNGKKVYGDYSEVLSGDVIDAPPANFRLEQKTATKIVFNWDKVEDAEGYVIYRYFPDTNKCKAIKNITSNDTLTYSYKVDANTDYQFTMRAFREVNGKKVYSDYTEVISN